MQQLSDEIRRRVGRLRCPDCRMSLVLSTDLRCGSCNRVFAAAAGTLDLTPSIRTDAKNSIASFWGDIYKQWYERDEAGLDRNVLLGELTKLEDLFRRRQHLPGMEMMLPLLADREVLEIGSGAGGHSALFRRYGARMTSVDLTPERVFSTQRKLQLLSDICPGDGLALRADAERLPFADASFDVVYSNGVLHHTPDTARAVAEAHRVLKPGGELLLMLYARHSAHFWLQLVPRGLLSGKLFSLPEEEWLGFFTEGKPRFRAARNPVTRVYSQAELKQLLSDFDIRSLRKFSFTFASLPVPRAEPLRSWVLKRFGFAAHGGGRLVYGTAVIPETPIELWLGKWCGFAWAIAANKS